MCHIMNSPRNQYINFLSANVTVERMNRPLERINKLTDGIWFTYFILIIHSLTYLFQLLGDELWTKDQQQEEHVHSLAWKPAYVVC